MDFVFKAALVSLIDVYLTYQLLICPDLDSYCWFKRHSDGSDVHIWLTCVVTRLDDGLT